MKNVVLFLLMCGWIAGGIAISSAGSRFGNDDLRRAVMVGSLVCWVVSWKKCTPVAGFVVYLCAIFIGNAMR